MSWKMRRRHDRLGAAIARLSVVVAAAGLWLSAPAAADSGFGDRIEISGRLSPETRLYPERALHPGQLAHASGFAAEATAFYEDDDGISVTLMPFLRYDAGDPDRTHFDLREAYLLIFGDIGDGEWELRLGVDRVFWGVVESRSLVDIVNQTDLVEHPNEKTKMGQLMIHLTWSESWGSLELFGMTRHRQRSFPGRRGRLRAGLAVDRDRTTYESASGEWHIDLAGRYSGSFGPVDIGLSAFDGTNREPVLLPTPAGSGLVLAPHYEQIRQLGLDIQLTTGSWLLKLEAVHRAGARNRRLVGHFDYQEEDYAAFIAGGEYTFGSVWDSDADLTLIAEWAHDGRGRWATHALDNDLLLAARLGLNDEQSTEFFLSVLESLDTGGRVLNAEFKRRLSDRWSLHVESSVYLGIERDDITYPVRHDSFIGVNLDYNF